MCLCLYAPSACTPPLLVGVCGVGVCAWARGSAAPRHSWLGLWGVCVFVCMLRLYPATPGRGVLCGCVCLGIGFRLRPATPGWGVRVWACFCARSACTRPLLAWVCGVGLCAWARVLAAPRHSWLGCWVCVCLCARSACTLPLLAGVCGVGVCAWARISAAVRHFWLGCWGVCVFSSALGLYPATLGWRVRRGCVCLGLGFGCAPPLLAGASGCVCVCVQALLVPRLSWLGCAAWVCVLGHQLSTAPRHSWLGCSGVGVFSCALRLYPATPGLGVWCGCVCLGSVFGCAPPLLAGLLGVCVFVCPLRLYPTTPGRVMRRGCVCTGSGFGCGPPLLPGVLRCVCVRVRAPLVSCHSRLGCVFWVCVWARVSAAPRDSWLGCWGVCVIVCPLRLYPATPGWGVRRGCVCLRSGFSCPSPLLAGVLGVCVIVCPLCLYPATPGWGVRCGCVFGLGFWLRPATPGWPVWVCVCSYARSACTPPILAWVCSVGVCARARVSAAARHSGLGCWGVCVFMLPAPLVSCHSCFRSVVCVCVFGLGFRLCPATPAWPVGQCVCSCARSACTPPLLARVCSVGLCAWAWVSAAPRHSWRGGWGVCVFVCAHHLYPATPGWGLWCVGSLLPGTCSCAVFRCGLCALRGFAAPGGRWCLAPVHVPWLWPAAWFSDVPCGPLFGLVAEGKCA